MNHRRWRMAQKTPFPWASLTYRQCMAKPHATRSENGGRGPSRKLYYVPFRRDIKWPRLPELRAAGFEGVSTHAVFQQAQKALAEMYVRASSGEQAAIKLLHQLAVEATTDLDALIRNHPEEVRERACWWCLLPVLASPKNRNTGAIKRLMAGIGLGKNLGKAYSTESRINFDLPVTHYAEAIRIAIEINQAVIPLCDRHPEIVRFVRHHQEVSEWPSWVQTLSKLPSLHELLFNEPEIALSRIDEFWKVGKLAFLEAHPHPEQINDLKPVLGKLAQSLSPAQQRARLLWQIRQSFESILRTLAVPNLRA